MKQYAAKLLGAAALGAAALGAASVVVGVNPAVAAPGAPEPTMALKDTVAKTLRVGQVSEVSPGTAEELAPVHRTLVGEQSAAVKAPADGMPTDAVVAELLGATGLPSAGITPHLGQSSVGLPVSSELLPWQGMCAPVPQELLPAGQFCLPVNGMY